jgi:hypothetical protein
MSNHNDNSIEAAGKEAERLLAELEAKAPVKSRQAAPSPPAQASRQGQKSWAWVLVAVLASMAGTLGIVSRQSTSSPSPSTATTPPSSGSEPPQAGVRSEPKTQTEAYNPPTPRESTAKEASGEALSQEQALLIIKGWLDAKPRVFAPPFISEAVDPFVANGPLWNDITKPGGSIDWLKTNASHYTYASSTVNNPISFSEDSHEPSITVSITQSMAFHGPKGTKETNSTDTYRYTFRQENGNWKIWDYKKQ